jgi:hypothetical protein
MARPRALQARKASAAALGLRAQWVDKRSMTILYPVAANAEAALHAPLGFAARERSAHDVAGEAVTFVTEAVGPAFENREAALDAYAGRLDDDRPGKRFAVAPEARWCVLRPVSAEDAKKRRRPARPLMKEGRRWPAPDPSTRPALWRLSVSYWRLGEGLPLDLGLEAARRVRRDPGAEQLEAKVLRQLAEQPLRAFRPQQPLDIGLFETRPPEAPHIIMPDE